MHIEVVGQKSGLVLEAFLQSDDIGADVLQHVQDPIRTCFPIESTAFVDVISN
jgi:hypothetical protein